MSSKITKSISVAKASPTFHAPMLIALIASSMIGSLTTYAASSSASVPKSLNDAAEYGENVYDYAKANDWKHADNTLGSLRRAVKQLRVDVVDQKAAEDRVDITIATLARDITAKDQQATMRESNEITRDLADMTAAYSPAVPVAVTKLDYYGRELEIWAQAQDENRLQATTTAMRHEWDGLRPMLKPRGAAEAKRFESIVVRAEA